MNGSEAVDTQPTSGARATVLGARIIHGVLNDQPIIDFETRHEIFQG